MLKELPHKIWNSKPINALKSFGKRLYLPGFDGIALYYVATFYWQGLQKGAIATRASAISFTIFLALLPSCLLLLSLIPYIPIENFQGELMNSFKELIPLQVYQLLEEALEDLIVKKHSTVLSLGFFLTLYYASNSINSILSSFNSSYHLTVKRNPFRQRLIALLLIVVLSALILVAIALMIFSDTFFNWLQGHDIIHGKFLLFLLHLAKWTLVVLLFFGSISILYNVGDTQKKEWRIVSAGSTLATVLIIVVSSGFAYYVQHFGNYNKLYGSLGTLIVLLLWIYLNSMVLLIGFELNTSIGNAQRTKAISEEEEPDSGTASEKL